MTTDGACYRLADDTNFPADDLPGAADLVIGAKTAVCGAEPAPLVEAADGQPDLSGRTLGDGERALRQLRDHGVI